MDRLKEMQKDVILRAIENSQEDRVTVIIGPAHKEQVQEMAADMGFTLVVCDERDIDADGNKTVRYEIKLL